MEEKNGNGIKKQLLTQAGVTTAPLLLVALWIASAIRDEHEAIRQRQHVIEQTERQESERLRRIEADVDRLERRTRWLPQSERR